MMTVRECIEYYKSKVSHRLTHIWLCPNIVNNPKMGKDYVVETSINSQLSESLLNTEVTKHWLEPKECICICYKYENNNV